MYDIVYFVKDSPKNEELRYSLRSLKNFPHKKVWFYGGCPVGLKPDEHISVEQNQTNKWKNVGKMLKLACNNPNISDKFWLFNDDFFVMRKVNNPVVYHNGDLYKRVVTLEDFYGRMTPYSKWLRECCKELNNIGTTTKNYETHTPFLVDKIKAKEVHNIIEGYAFRSLYGNYCEINSIDHKDVKISSYSISYKDGDYVSTDDFAFLHGVVGKQIKEKFKDKCEYEY